MYSRKNEILYAIRNKLVPLGFKEIFTNSPDFSIAYVHKGVLASLVFLINNFENIEPQYLPYLISNAHLFCKQYLRSKWIFKEAGLNLILLHQGALTENNIDGYTTKTGFDSSVTYSGAIFQSITTINTIDFSVCQSRIWVVVGKVKKALNKLQYIP